MLLLKDLTTKYSSEGLVGVGLAEVDVVAAIFDSAADAIGQLSLNCRGTHWSHEHGFSFSTASTKTHRCRLFFQKIFSFGNQLMFFLLAVASTKKPVLTGLPLHAAVFGLSLVA